MYDEAFWRLFHELYEDLPRQGPGQRESTLRALGMLPHLTAGQRILDIGCGSGAQTLDLASACDARIVALDRHPPFVARLRARAAALGLADRISAEVGDMGDPRFPDGAFDLLWCEGAIFIVGFARGLAGWRRLLAPGGHLVVSELCWLRPDPPAELEAFFRAEGADICDLPARRRLAAEGGYRLVGDFVLPAAGWWESYYLPLGEALGRFRGRHPGDPVALEVAARADREIDLYRRYEGSFGYGFFVMQRVERSGG